MIGFWCCRGRVTAEPKQSSQRSDSQRPLALASWSCCPSNKIFREYIKVLFYLTKKTTKQKSGLNHQTRGSQPLSQFRGLSQVTNPELEGPCRRSMLLCKKFTLLIFLLASPKGHVTIYHDDCTLGEKKQ